LGGEGAGEGEEEGDGEGEKEEEKEIKKEKEKKTDLIRTSMTGSSSWSMAGLVTSPVSRAS
jgi:hypothetical protein